MPWDTSGLARVSRILLLQSSRWESGAAASGWLWVGPDYLAFPATPILSHSPRRCQSPLSCVTIILRLIKLVSAWTRLGFRHWSNDDTPFAQALRGRCSSDAPSWWPLVEGKNSRGVERGNSACLDAQSPMLADFPSRAARTCRLCRPPSYQIEAGIFELGVHLGPPSWGRGLAGETARAVIKFAFENINANALFARHHPAKAASHYLILKLGFRLMHEEFYPPTGLLLPTYLLECSSRA
jgi:ribosomal-protein-alanine N-acetyltransferase